MRMSKDICKKCINEQDYDDKWKWKKGDDDNWEKGIVSCPYTFPKDIRIISTEETDEVPKNCKFKMEHTVLSQ